MRIGVPAEVKNNEFRVALTPSGVHDLVARGHEVNVQSGAGRGSSLTDADFVAAGARVIESASDVWASAELVLKVKEPQPEEFAHLRDDLVLFTYLHLAAEPDLTRALCEAKTTSIAYETVQAANGTLPLLAPRSEVAGRLAPLVGAHLPSRRAQAAAAGPLWEGRRAAGRGREQMGGTGPPLPSADPTNHPLPPSPPPPSFTPARPSLAPPPASASCGKR